MHSFYPSYTINSQIFGGETISGTGIISGTYITGKISGTGALGTYTVSNNHPTATGTIAITAQGPYYFNTILIPNSYTLTIGSNEIVYCKLLQVAYGGVLANYPQEGQQKAVSEQTITPPQTAATVAEAEVQGDMEKAAATEATPVAVTE